nr:MAG: capsid protein [Cressdnaviricota sp.]
MVRRYKYARAIKKGLYKAASTAVAGYSAYRRMKAPVRLPKKKKYKKSVSIHQASKAGIGGHGGTYTTFYYTPRKMPLSFKRNFKALSKNYYTINGAIRYTSAVGLQNSNTIQSMFNYTDLNAISQKVSANQTNKVLMKSCSSELMITNQDAANSNIIIYDIIARRDLATTSNLATPDVAWARSYGDEGATNSNWNIPGSTPFSADLFTQFYRVCKISHVTLGQGQCHTHRVKFSPNIIIDGELIQYNTNGLKGVTCFTMVVQSGFPQNDVTTKSQVSLGQTTLDFVYKKQYSYTWMSDNDTTYSTTNSLPTTFTVGESVMSEATGAAITDSAA